MYFERAFLVSNFLKSLTSRNYSNDAKEEEGGVKHIENNTLCFHDMKNLS